MVRIKTTTKCVIDRGRAVNDKACFYIQKLNIDRVVSPIKGGNNKGGAQGRRKGASLEAALL